VLSARKQKVTRPSDEGLWGWWRRSEEGCVERGNRCVCYMVEVSCRLGRDER